MTPPPSDSKPEQEISLLGPDGGFAQAWLSGKSVAPVPAGTRLDAVLIRRIEAGCRAVGTQDILDAQPAAGAHDRSAAVPRKPTKADLAGTAPPAILYTPDLQGAVLFPEPGYTLIAGSEAFLAGAVSEGIDAARARFGRYARAMKTRWPHLQGIATAHPPTHRAGSHPSDVTPGTASARLMSLLGTFAQGTCTAPEFADGWWEARRAAHSQGERASEDLADLLDRVFTLLEDYTPDPALREPGDLTESELRERIHSLVRNTERGAERR
ncbi:colicin immunity domain-containing protein [Streptomyces sp. SBC-4]|nr:colicin immunity domain-containing protein [Streptomyces sp. SBC-4]MDV5146880.1 colicin immunity domain-containing protein [Streptomyces sp. SBC-4]